MVFVLSVSIVQKAMSAMVIKDFSGSVKNLGVTGKNINGIEKYNY